MPTYDYKCLKCGTQFEKLQAAAAPAPKCLECGHNETQKLISSPALVFKGSGFYKTDTIQKKPPPPSTTTSPENKSNTPSESTAEKKEMKKENKEKNEN